MAKLAFFFIFTLAQFLIVLALFLLYGARYSFNIANILHLILYISIINTLIGLIIGLISENEGIAVLFSLMISFPLMLLSGIFFPIQTLPKITQLITKALPLFYQIKSTKAVLLFGESINWNFLYLAIPLFLGIWYLSSKKN